MGWAELPEYKTCNQTKDELYRNIVKRIDITCHTGNQSGNESRDEACNRSEQVGSQNRSVSFNVRFAFILRPLPSETLSHAGRRAVR